MAKVFSIDGNTISYGGFLLRELGNGSLTISKTVSGSGFDPAKTFEITVVFSAPVTYNGTTSTTHTFNLANGQSVTITDIPELTEYEVTEAPLSQADLDLGYSISGITGGSGTIGNSDTHTASASNTYSHPATLTITKTVSGNTPSPSEQFEIVVTFSRAIAYSVDGVAISTPSATYTGNLVNGQSVIIGNIPAGVTYNVTENLTPAEQAAGYSNTGISNSSGTAAWGAAYASVVRNLLLSPIAPYTIRFKFSNDYDPTSSDWEAQPTFWKSGSTWTHISSDPNIWEYHRQPSDSKWDYEFKYDDPTFIYHYFNRAEGIEVIAANLGGITSVRDWLFDSRHALVGVSGIVGTSNMEDFSLMFNSLYRLQRVSLFDTSSGLLFGNMFSSCESIEEIPLFDTSNATNIGEICIDCSSLKRVPLFSVPNVTVCRRAFYRCYNVEGGALDLYNRLSALSISSYNHSGTFAGCGVDTTTGAAELAQIPSDWKNY